MRFLHSLSSNKIHLEGDGGWDYLAVDDSASRLYVSHGTIVQVVDLNDNKLIGTIPDTKGVHGIAIARDLGKGFISNGRDSSVTIFTLKTLEVTGKVKVTGANPDAILYDPGNSIIIKNFRIRSFILSLLVISTCRRIFAKIYVIKY